MKKYRLFGFVSILLMILGFLAFAVGSFGFVLRLSVAGTVVGTIEVMAAGAFCIVVGFASKVLIDIEENTRAPGRIGH
jgi:hypothetical protein